jgi:GT2 family glycosyltransferase
MSLSTARSDISISFVIPVRNDAARLAACLDTIAVTGGSSGTLEVIVADNGSTDASVGVARAAGARVLRLPGLRVSELRNAAAAIATGSILAFVDSDHELDPGWRDVVIDAFDDPAVGAVGALCRAPSPGTWVQRAYDALRHRPAGRIDVTWLGSGNLAVRRDAFEQVGGFDVTLDTCEDVDLCGRLRAAGLRVVSDDRIVSIHHGDPATLDALFRSELWRGRDNLRASFREPMTWRSWPSVAIPVVNLLCVLGFAAGALTIPWGGWRLAIMAAGASSALAAARAVRMLTAARETRLPVLAAFPVAFVYHAARALALISRAGYYRTPGRVHA